MSAAALLHGVNAAVVLAIAAFALWRAVNKPSRLKVDAALLLGTAAVVVVVRSASVEIGVIASSLAVLYLLLRLLDDFVKVPPAIHAVAVGGWVACTVVLVLGGAPIPLWAGAILAFYSAVFVGYLTLGFARLASTLADLNRRRISAAAVATPLLAAGLAIDAVSYYASPSAEWAMVVADGLTTLGAIGYVIAFAPPRWLIAFWREATLRQFILDTVRLSGSDHVDGAVADLEKLAVRVIGAATVSVGLWNSESSTFRFARTGVEVPLVGSMTGEIFESQEAAFRLRRNIPKTTFALLLSSDVSRAAALLGAPVSVAGERYGVLMASADRVPFFAEHDLALVDLIAVQIALVIQSVHRNQAFRQQAELLDSANRHKAQFLASMSHELRTPLNAILGFSQLLRDDKDGHYAPETRDKFLSQINTSGQHLLSLINEVLDLSKVDAGQMDLHLETIGAGEIVETVVATVEPIARSKNITVVVPPTERIDLVADPGKLKQMLLNLVSNAIKFTAAGGRVTIEVQKFGTEVRFAVSDTGIGISASNIPRLFTEFQQLDAGPGRRQEGTGLGLALTKRFAELHGGNVAVRSELDKGSTFTLSLPASGKSPASQAATDSPSGLAESRRPLILVVEDNPAAAEILTRYLEAGEFRHHIATNGPDAVRLARELKPVAITLDILLPGIDGWEVLAQLKADSSTRDIPVVVVTVVDKPALGRALGALDYFVKPVDGPSLISHLRRYAFTPKSAAAKVKVLVVDDEASNRKLLDEVLRSAGFEVVTAGDGATAIKLAQGDPPDVVLLDLVMPKLSGFQVVEALKSKASTRSIPIIVLTAKDLTADDKRRLNGDVEAIFERNSVAVDDLTDWLRALIGKRRVGSPA